MKVKKIDNRFGLVQSGFLFIDSLDTLFKKLSLANKTPSVVFQLVPASALVSERQAWLGLWHTAEALDSGSAISKKTEFEVLLRLSGKRQVGRALEQFAFVERKKQEAVLLGIGKNKKSLIKEAQNLGHELGFAQKNGLLEKNFSKNKKQILAAYGISPRMVSSFLGWKEKESMEALVIEKMALLSLEE